MENSSLSPFNGTEIENDALPYTYKVVFTGLYVVAGLLSMVSNVLVILVLVVRKRLPLGVRCTLINLAITDILMASFGIPDSIFYDIYAAWYSTRFVCKLSLFMTECTQFVSVFTLIAIGISRYLAIVFPLKYQQLRSDRAVLLAMVFIWIAASVLYHVVFVYGDARQVDADSTWCRIFWPNIQLSHYYFMVNFALTFAVPLLILTFTYSSIAYKLSHRTSPGNADTERDAEQRHSMIKVVKMLVVIVVVFIICWAPIKIIEFVREMDTGAFLARSPTEFHIMRVTFHLLSTVNCFVDSFVYCFSNNNFWNDLKFIFSKLKRRPDCRKRREKNSTRGNGSSSGHATAVSLLSSPTVDLKHFSNSKCKSKLGENIY